MQSIYNILSSKEKVLILGFGREGRSTYRYFKAQFPNRNIWIADENPAVSEEKEFSEDNTIIWKTGRDCYSDLSDFDLIVKTPGIPLKKLENTNREIISSQTDLFIREYFAQIIGISGTKGKSTTSSLIHHILKENGKDSMLAGNIGIPVFDLLQNIKSDSLIVMELSAHQGEILHRAPSKMVLLNIFQEHLDHFGDFDNYRNAKFNFCKKQHPGDTLVYFADDKLLRHCNTAIKGVNHIPLSATNEQEKVFFSNEIIRSSDFEIARPFCALKGKHNLINIAAAATVCFDSGIDENAIKASISSFKPLEHRLEYVDTIDKIKFYNDSISTIPEAAIAAMEALEDVKWIILGGFDRGISYDGLIKYLKENEDMTMLLMGKAGERIKEIAERNEFSENRISLYETMDNCIDRVLTDRKAKGICLLSPAASSYDRYKNFEERGSHFKALIKESGVKGKRKPQHIP